jgi:hypothetical protein
VLNSVRLLEPLLSGIQSLEQSHHHRLQGSEVFQQAVSINLQRAAFSRPARPAPVPAPDLPTR